jgi:hypothetical protein
MSESMQFITGTTLQALKTRLTGVVQPADYGLPGDMVFKGFVIVPSFDVESLHPVMYLNPVFSAATPGAKDIIVQTDDFKTCPYPPGYPAGQPPTPKFAK